MTTLVVRLTPPLAKALAKFADAERLSHEDAAREALRVFLRLERESARAQAGK